MCEQFNQSILNYFIIYFMKSTCVFSKTLWLGLFFISINQLSQAQISGKAFRDFNANGTKDNSTTFNETFEGNIVVNAYNSSGVLLATQTTSGIGTTSNYTFPATGANSITSGTVVRLEFILPNYYFASNGNGSNSSIQFVTAGATATANLGINSPNDFCQSNPFLASSAYVSSPGNTGANNLSALPVGTGGTGAPGRVELNSPYSTTGATWGMAHQRESNKLFTTAFMKRHAAFGSGGTGAIYVTSNTNTPATSATSLYFNLQSVLSINTGANPHATDLTIDQNNVNGSPFDAVGKMSLGDLDISNDGKYLFTINLNEKKLHRIFIDNPAKPAASLTSADVTTWTIPNPCDATKGTSRPWGLGMYQGKVYVGVICDGSISLTRNDLSATVYEFIPSTGVFTQVLTFPLNFSRGALSGMVAERDYWEPWRNTWYKNPASQSYGGIDPQPVLADIEFDIDGSMIIGFLDRFSHQSRLGGGDETGVGSYDPRLGGDILRAGKCSTANTWTIENNASVCGGTATTGAGNGNGPGGGEFYHGDQFNNNHFETSEGGLSMLRGSGQVIVGGMDPLSIYSAGFYYMNNTTGAADLKYELVGNSAGVYGKAGAIGDIEMLCNPQPIEIGNLVFLDTDKDGIQDADETGLNGIIIDLYQGATKVGSTTTATINGQVGSYFFTNANVNLGGATGILQNIAYEIRIPNISGGSKQTNLGANVLTSANQGANDLIDSDGTTSGTNAIIALTTAGSGENNYSYDFGFFFCPSITTPSATQTLCIGSNGSNITVNTTQTTTNGIKFMRFASAQTGAAMYTGGTLLTGGTVTASGGIATYIWNSSDFINAGTTPITYYVYAILNPDLGAACQPFQEIQIVVNPLPSFTLVQTNVTCFGNGNGTITATTTSGTSPFTYSKDDGANFLNTTGVFDNLTPATYKIAVKDNNGCMKKCN